MSLCRRPYIDRRKEFSEEERDRLTKIDNEIWEKAKDSKLFFKVYPLVGKPGYQIKNNAASFRFKIYTIITAHYLWAVLKLIQCILCRK